MTFRQINLSAVNTSISSMTDPLIAINSEATGSNTKDLGMIFSRGSDTNVALLWDESTDQFAFINTDEAGLTSGNVTIASYSDLKVNDLIADNVTGATVVATTGFTGNLTGNVTGSTTGINYGNVTATVGTSTFNNITMAGNLIVNGTTTTVNSTVVDIADPIITLGSSASDDNKDRGIAFKWNTGGSTKVGFFGYDDSDGKFTFITDGAVTSEVSSGTLGTIKVGGIDMGGDLDMDSNDVLNVDTLRINQAGTGLRMTGVGAFDNDGSDNFRIFSNGDLILSTNGDTGTAVTFDQTTKDAVFQGGITTTGTVTAGNINNTGTLTVSGAVNFNDTTGSTSTTTGALIVDGGVAIAENLYVGGTIDMDRLSLTSSQTTVPPLRLTANNLNNGVGALRIDGSQADIYLNPSTATHTTVTFAVNDDQRVAFGMDNNSDFYITRRTSSTWYDDTFVLDRDTGLLSLGYGATISGSTQINSLNINNAYTLPTADGSANQFLQTDGSGSLSFVGLTHNENSSPYIVTTSDVTNNTGSTLAISSATLGFDLSDAVSYNIFINRLHMRSSEVSVNTSNGTITVSADILETSDEIDAVWIT